MELPSAPLNVPETTGFQPPLSGMEGKDRVIADNYPNETPKLTLRRLWRTGTHAVFDPSLKRCVHLHANPRLILPVMIQHHPQS
jgi:hypothetical protein